MTHTPPIEITAAPNAAWTTLMASVAVLAVATLVGWVSQRAEWGVAAVLTWLVISSAVVAWAVIVLGRGRAGTSVGVLWWDGLAWWWLPETRTTQGQKTAIVACESPAVILDAQRWMLLRIACPHPGESGNFFPRKRTEWLVVSFDRLPMRWHQQRSTVLHARPSSD